MHNLLLFIPFIFCIFLLIFFNKKVVWWEYLIFILPSLLIIYIGTLIMISSNCCDKEWLSWGVNKIRYYEPWDEWLARTEIDSDGNTIYTTDPYDSLYIQHYDEKWTIVLNDETGIEQDIKKENYEKIKSRWIIPNKNIQKFVDMNRDYYHLDGDMYELNWNDSIKDYFCYTLENNYKNKVKASKSIFKFEDITNEIKETNSLYDYYEVKKHPDLGFILGWFNADNVYNQKVYGSDDIELNKQFDYINGILGPQKEIQIHLLIWNSQKYSKDVAFLQQSYWEGGNKNELNICIGVDSTARKINWCKTFSWSETPETEVRIESFFNSCDSLSNNNTFISLQKFLITNINKYWKRKEFKDFDYLKPELSISQLKTLMWIIIVWCISIFIFVVLNNIIYSNNLNIIDKNEKY